MQLDIGRAFGRPSLERLAPLWIVIGAFGIGAASQVGGPMAVLALAGLASLAAIFVWPRLAFLALIVLLPVDIHIRTGFVLDAVMDPARLIVAIAVFARAYRGRRPLTSRRIVWTALAYVGAVVASLLYAHLILSITIPFDSIRYVYKLASYLAFGLASLVIVKDAEDLRRMYWSLIAGLWATCIYALYQFAISGFGPLYNWAYPLNELESWNGRPPGLLNYANSQAGYIVLVLPIALAVWLYSRQRRTAFLSALTVLLAAVALILTQSRGGWAAAFVVIAILTLRFTSPALRAVSLSAVILLASCFAFVLPFTASRIQDFDFRIVDSRLGLWEAAWRFFLSSPVFGIGYGTYQIRYPELVRATLLPGAPTIQSHNVYLQLLAETGLIGLCVFLLLIGMVVVRCLRGHVRALTDQRGFVAGIYIGLSVAFLGLLVHGFVDVLFEASPQFASLFWLLVFVAAARPGVLQFQQGHHARADQRKPPAMVPGSMIGRPHEEGR